MNPFIFLIGTLFNLYIAALLLRFIFQLVRADFYNPISQFIVKVTQPPVGFARKLIPGFKGLDIATLILVIAFIFIKRVILDSLGVASYPSLIVHGLRDLVQLSFDIFIYAIIIQAILSWVNPDPYNPVSSLLSNLTNPVLKPVRKYLPPMGGLDLSPLFAIIGLMFIKLAVLYMFPMR